MFVGEQHGRTSEAVDFYVSIFRDGRLAASRPALTTARSRARFAGVKVNKMRDPARLASSQPPARQSAPPIYILGRRENRDPEMS
jgi:hypothetical protein